MSNRRTHAEDRPRSLAFPRIAQYAVEEASPLPRLGRANDGHVSRYDRPDRDSEADHRQLLRRGKEQRSNGLSDDEAWRERQDQMLDRIRPGFENAGYRTDVRRRSRQRTRSRSLARTYSRSDVRRTPRKRTRSRSTDQSSIRSDRRRRARERTRSRSPIRRSSTRRAAHRDRYEYDSDEEDGRRYRYRSRSSDSGRR